MRIQRLAIVVMLALGFGLALSAAATAVGLDKQCGGKGRIRCDAGLWCQKPGGTCRVSNGFGRCARVPTACTRIFLPVCGCDGKTYGNDCMRQSEKVQLAYAGECKP